MVSLIKKKNIIILYFFIRNLNCLSEISKEIIEKENASLKGTFFINSLYKGKSYLSCVNNKLIISQKKEYFDIIETIHKSYYLICRNSMKIIGIGLNKGDYKLMLYSSFEQKNNNLIVWKLKNIKEELFYIQNVFNSKYLIFEGDNLDLKNFYNQSFSINNYEFRILKLYEEIGKIDSYQLKIIEDEPIDLFMKYIDLRDKNLNREGIKQIYKDFDNEELRYSLRSINEYLPWIRKIFIVMPNKEVKFLKPYEEIRDKIIYVNDKDFIGFDSANIFAFSFNLYKMKKFGISKNFIYMEDDYFIGKKLKKTDFFYYDIKEKKVYPYIINTKFFEMDKEKILKKQKNMDKKKAKKQPQSGFGWNFSLMNTDKYFLEKYKTPIISAKFTHCALPMNLYDIQEIFNEIQDYPHINETLFSKTRHILTLNQPEFFNLYQLNIKHRKVHQINNAYINMEKIKLNHLEKLNIELFVLNTGGNHEPSKEKQENLKKIMEKRFPKSTTYEKINENINGAYKLRYTSKSFYKLLIILFIFIIFIKSIKNNKNKYIVEFTN